VKETSSNFSYFTSSGFVIFSLVPTSMGGISNGDRYNLRKAA
jgi:hypothetical protein